MQSYTFISFQMIGYGECGLFLSKHTACVCVCSSGWEWENKKLSPVWICKNAFHFFFCCLVRQQFEWEIRRFFGKSEKIKLKKLFPFVYLHTLGDVQCIRYLNLLFFQFVFTSPFLFNNFFQVFSFVAKRYKKTFFSSLFCVYFELCAWAIFFFFRF